MSLCSPYIRTTTQLKSCSNANSLQTRARTAAEAKGLMETSELQGSPHKTALLPIKLTLSVPTGPCKTAQCNADDTNHQKAGHRKMPQLEANKQQERQVDLCEQRAAGRQLLDRHEGPKLASSFGIVDGAGQDCMWQLQMGSQHLCKVHVQLPWFAQLVVQRHLCSLSQLRLQLVSQQRCLCTK